MDNLTPEQEQTRVSIMCTFHLSVVSECMTTLDRISLIKEGRYDLAKAKDIVRGLGITIQRLYEDAVGVLGMVMDLSEEESRMMLFKRPVWPLDLMRYFDDKKREEWLLRQLAGPYAPAKDADT